MSAQILERDGRPAFAVLPIEEYEELVREAEDSRDAATLSAFAERLSDGREEVFPAEVAEAILDGANPLRVMRTHRGLTLAQVAAACGVTPAHVSQLEHGKRALTVDMLKRLAQALHLDPALLL
jgi:antitoxin component HigA of HigAB toxin-antitoxin module